MTVHAFPVLYDFDLNLAIVHLVQNFLYKLNSPKEDIRSIFGFILCFLFSQTLHFKPRECFIQTFQKLGDLVLSDTHRTP